MPWFEAAFAGAAILIADQASKYFVLTRPRTAIVPAPRSFLAICCIINTRGAARVPRLLPAAAFVLCAVFAIVALTQEPLRRSVIGTAGIGFAFGGIVSNFIDLMRRGGIVDFIAIGPLPVCNIADFAILGGLALVILALTLWALG